MRGYPKTVYVVHVTAPFFGRAWEERPTGYSVRYDMHDEDAADRLATLEATIARLTAELTETREKETLERRKVQNLMEQLAESEKLRGALIEKAAQVVDQRRSVIEVGTDLSRKIRALDPIATAALAELLDAETRACAEMLPNCDSCGGSAAILARLDQRKEGGA